MHFSSVSLGVIGLSPLPATIRLLYIPASVTRLSFQNALGWGVSTEVGVTPIKVTLDQTWSQLAITCSKLTIETLEQGVKYVQS